MRRIGIAVLALLALGGAARAELKIAFVNSEIILAEYKAVKGLMETFNRDVEAWDAELQQKKKELDQLQKELPDLRLRLSEQRFQEQESEYQRKLAEYEKFKESIWASDGLIEQRNEELFRPVISKVQTVLEQLAAEEGYDLILDAADSNILFGDPALDLTQRVLDLLNQEAVPGASSETASPGSPDDRGEER
jgi:outer membrane protein